MKELDFSHVLFTWKSNLLTYTVLGKQNSRTHVLKDFIMVCWYVCACFCVFVLAAEGEQVWEMTLLV